MTLASLAARLLAATHSATPGVEIGQIMTGLALAGLTGGNRGRTSLRYRGTEEMPR